MMQQKVEYNKFLMIWKSLKHNESYKLKRLLSKIFVKARISLNGGYYEQICKMV